ncbi:hypothetical protein DN752_13995 [Echinicola strongylocentroti]|uniref:Uncharacterized protein n=1 Tax=Echinicola strongylocentroti TaxID=1795355 RepID=A0A2Z4IKB3_9BACT|nr:hypothetical protein [Echinicola strongylocentroti]AWW31149.1 hypothetical protein DN752_13995 [Echinicola strongylocentroti]
MKAIIKLISFIALALNLIPAFLVFQGIISPDQCKTLMFIGTVLWFITAPMWMNKKSEEASS